MERHASPTIRITVVQPASGGYGEGSPLGRKRENLSWVASELSRIEPGSTDVIVLPEFFPQHGIDLRDGVAEQVADDVGGETFESLSNLAARCDSNLIAPVLERTETGLADTAWVFDRDGGLVGSQSKVHLRRDEHEDLGIQPGDAFRAIPLDCCTLGAMICLDIAFPESARCLALDGADVIAWPHLYTGWGETNYDAVLRSRAIENAVAIVASSYGTGDRAWMPGMFIGRSGVVGPDGTYLLDMGRRVGSATVEIDHPSRHLIREFVDAGDVPAREAIFSARRPETYGSIGKTQTS